MIYLSPDLQLIFGMGIVAGLVGMWICIIVSICFYQHMYQSKVLDFIFSLFGRVLILVTGSRKID